MADRLRSFAEWVDAPLGFVLEGGYGLETLTDSIRTVHEVFDGYQPEPPADPVQPAARAVIDRVAAEGFERVETPVFGPALATPDDGDAETGGESADEAGDADAENVP